MAKGISMESLSPTGPERNVPCHCSLKINLPRCDTCEQSSQSMQLLLIDTLEIARLLLQLTCESVLPQQFAIAAPQQKDFWSWRSASFRSSHFALCGFGMALLCCGSMALWIRRSPPGPVTLRTMFYTSSFGLNCPSGCERVCSLLRGTKLGVRVRKNSNINFIPLKIFL